MLNIVCFWDLCVIIVSVSFLQQLDLKKIWQQCKIKMSITSENEAVLFDCFDSFGCNIH